MQLQILNDREATTYINTLGQNLAMHAPTNEKYPFQFKIVNDTAINAFALPGGFIYVNRGAIDAADNESQIAGVIGHEIGHVVLRHGTHQVSKAYVAQAPLAVLGGALGSNSVGGILAQLGMSLGLNSLFLKYSRDAENQADLMGTQILHDSGYNPKAMVEFFEKIQAESKGRSSQFFSDHPVPENRISNVQHEIEKLGGAPPNAQTDTPEFQKAKHLIAGLPAPKGGAGGSRGGNRPSDTRGGKPQPPSTRLTTYSGNELQFIPSAVSGSLKMWLVWPSTSPATNLRGQPAQCWQSMAATSPSSRSPSQTAVRRPPADKLAKLARRCRRNHTRVGAATVA